MLLRLKSSSIKSSDFNLRSCDSRLTLPPVWLRKNSPFIPIIFVLLSFLIGISIFTSLSRVEKSNLELISSIFEILRLASLRMPFGLYFNIFCKKSTPNQEEKILKSSRAIYEILESKVRLSLELL